LLALEALLELLLIAEAETWKLSPGIVFAAGVAYRIPALTLVLVAAFSRLADPKYALGETVAFHGGCRTNLRPGCPGASMNEPKLPVLRA
jgi:hypothetical protein